jgi:hypothetical protein
MWSPWPNTKNWDDTSGEHSKQLSTLVFSQKCDCRPFDSDGWKRERRKFLSKLSFNISSVLAIADVDLYSHAPNMGLEFNMGNTLHWSLDSSLSSSVISSTTTLMTMLGSSSLGPARMESSW